MNLEDLYRLLRSSHVQTQGIVDTIDEPLVVLDQGYCVLDANRAFFASFLVERDDTVGASLFTLGNGQWDIPELKHLLSEVLPKSVAVIDYEVTHNFPLIGARTFLLTARRLFRPDNNSTQVLLVFTDVTDNRRKERESSLLFSELRHRMINLLGMVQATANRTETRGVSAEEYKETFLGRFRALMKAQTLISGGTVSIDLATLVSELVSSLGGEQLVISGGPSINITSKQVVPLAMILHELVSNAIKYGALGKQGGTVQVNWQIDAHGPENPSLRLEWLEACNCPLPSPSQMGTGTSIIQESARLGLYGKAELVFEQDGLKATLLIPLAQGNEEPE
jgi:two-component sensor histidine kinase